MPTESNNDFMADEKHLFGERLAEWLAPFFFTLTEQIFLQTLPPKDTKVMDENRPIELVITREELIRDSSLTNRIWDLNKTRGVYFRPNAGGSTDASITRFNAFFAEFDDLPIDEQLQRFKNAPIPPSILVITKKSVHAYWLIDGDCNEEQWRDIQARLIAYFNSDSSIKNPSRLMRLPGFNHVSVNKDGSIEYKMVECVLFESSRRYTVEKMRFVFPSDPSTNLSKRFISRYDEPVGKGERNSRLYRIGCYYRDLGLDEDEIAIRLKIHNQRICIEPLPDEEVEELACNACKYAKGSGFHNTELGNAKRLISRHGNDLRYCDKWKCWLVWDGKYWLKDEGGGEVERRAKETILSIYEEAILEKDGTKRVPLVRWALRSESEKVLRSTISMARFEPGVPIEPEQLDVDPFLLNVQNGTINLKTGELREHLREDYITKIVAAEYDPYAKAPQFRAFLSRITDGQKELIEYLQRAIGYSITGLTTEQVLFLCWGSGANGKSTFLETLLFILNDYALNTTPETLMVKRTGSIPNDVARLKGARLVTAVESEEGQTFSESNLKQFTGGDTITARFMRAEWFSFKPEFKLWIATNHKPEIKGTDHAIWRRVRLIPFEVRIPEAEQDKRLQGKLQEEMAGILQWAVEGCLAWQREGLGTPDIVKKATTDYQAEMDNVGSFLADCCDLRPDARVSIEELFHAYLDYCSTEGEYPLEKKKLSSRLKERGFKQGKSGDRYWSGIGLKSDVSKGKTTARPSAPPYMDMVKSY